MPKRPLSLREWLDTSGVRPAYLAERVGVSVATVYRWRAGARVVQLAHAVALVEVSRGLVSLSTLERAA
mgnify:CR=1 FL=1